MGCSYCCLYESLVRYVRSFPSYKLRIIKEEISSRTWWSFSCYHKNLKIHKWVCLYLLENPRKKESVVSELARGRVSKFLLVGSNRDVSGLSPVEKLWFFHSGFRFILRIVRLNPLQVFTGLVSWVIISLCYLSFHYFAWYDCLIVIS